ncbi:MAG TPA: hypothetical protein VHE33_10455 [Acidobacteriaceae bacterium]|nr:hypothetical protein [Acidobacteriaceae bacterium]
MTYPQQPYPDPSQQPYGQPAPGYPQQPVPQAQFQQPQYPQYTQTTYTQPYAPQQQGTPQQMMQPEPELPRGSLTGFFGQPAGGGGPGLTFETLGTRYVGTVSRNVTAADVHVVTKMRPRPGEDPVDRHPDGRPKESMWIPLVVQPSPQFPNGEATWYVKPNERAELLRAMQEAGVETDPETGFMYPPRAGDVIDITYIASKPNRGGMSDTKVKKVVYTKGNGQAPVPAYVQQAQQQIQAQPQQGAQPQQWGQPSPNNYPVPGGTQFAMPGPGQPPYQTVAGRLPPQQPQFQQSPPPQQPVYGQPNADWNPAAQQQPVPTPAPAPAVPLAQPGPGATGTASVSPSKPADWPDDVRFIPGLTVEQARMAQVHQIQVPGQ